MVKMTEPVTKLNLDTPAGLLSVMADCEDGKYKAVAFDNVPAFVHKLDLPVDVPGLGVISVDIAWGGMHYAIVDARSVGLEINGICQSIEGNLSLDKICYVWHEVPT